MDISEYFVKIHPLVFKEDLPGLPSVLREDFEDYFVTVLETDPYERCGEIDGHILERPPLVDFWTMDLVWNKIHYRLVYKINEATKTVMIFSFDEHKPAYHKAHERVRETTGYRD